MKARRICEIISGRYHRDPLNGYVYMFMSKDQRKVRMMHYERNAYYLHDKSFIKGYRFMKIERKDNTQIKSLQSDGYNVYMYLDNELIDVKHLCCLAHARAKFKYAYDLGSLQARIFLELIARLYGMEDTYLREKLTADEIYSRRNSKETTEIIDRIRTELYDLLANPDESRSELMSKALNYLKNFWNQIFAYRNDGECSIDNIAAERAIRPPVTVQRKNSLFLGSVKGIQNSAIYNTFIETCKQAGVSFRDHFCRLLRELKKGRTDYENLLPMTICK